MVDRKADLSGFTEGFVAPLRSTEVLCVSLEAGMLMLSFFSQISSEGRVDGAQPELWSITSEITIAVTHLDRMKEKVRQRVNKKHIYTVHISFFPFVVKAKHLT